MQVISICIVGAKQSRALHHSESQSWPFKIAIGALPASVHHERSRASEISRPYAAGAEGQYEKALRVSIDTRTSSGVAYAATHLVVIGPSASSVQSCQMLSWPTLITTGVSPCTSQVERLERKSFSLSCALSRRRLANLPSWQYSRPSVGRRGYRAFPEYLTPALR
jgi:hypothetical protein